MNQPVLQPRPNVRPFGAKLKAFWPALAWATLVFVLSSIPGHRIPAVRISLGDKLVHGCVYAVLGALCFRGFVRGTTLRGKRAFLAAAALALAYGICDEIHQLFVPKRSAEVWDAVADGIGAAIGAAGALSFWQSRRRV